MPIAPENRVRYPKEWKSIRAEVLARAGDRCEWPGCGVQNGAIGFRVEGGRFFNIEKSHQGDADAADGRADGARIFRVVLTIAHRDHTPENNGTPGNRPNLAAWCQYHHLRYDHAHHIANGRATRVRKKGQEALPL